MIFFREELTVFGFVRGEFEKNFENHWASCSITEILFAVSPSVFSWSTLGRESSAAFLLLRPEENVL